MKNYRAITTLSFLAKYFENFLHKRMIDFIYIFNLLNSSQFGITPDHNTSDAILEFLDIAYQALNISKLLLAIFLDFCQSL